MDVRVTANLRRRTLLARQRAEALLDRNVDYIQDPHTGLLHGSRPHGGGGGGDTPIAMKLSHYKPGVYGAQDEASTLAFKERWAAESPVKSINTAVALATPTQKVLDHLGKDMANEFDVKWKNPGPKTHTKDGSPKPAGISRVEVKAHARQHRGGIAAVTDIVRGSFIVQTPEQVDKIIAKLGEKVEVLSEEWRQSPVNYFDRTALLRFGNGMVAEIQFMDAAMEAAKSSSGSGGHELYSEWRALPDGPRKDELHDKQAKLYGGVLKSYPPAWRAAVDRAALKASLGKGGKSGN